LPSIGTRRISDRCDQLPEAGHFLPLEQLEPVFEAVHNFLTADQR
jgi:hypothetical protein